MTNQLEINVLYANGNPLKVPQTASFLTSGILIYEVKSISGITCAIEYYNNQSNLLAFELYYSDQNLNDLYDTANANGTTMVGADVISKNNSPFPTSVYHMFPANGVKFTKIDNDTTRIQFKNDIYICSNNIDNLISESNYIWYQGGYYFNGNNNVTAIGNIAGQNQLNGMTIFSNGTLPSYIDRAAALAAINTGTGAVAGSTYLYYNQTTFAIEGVRL